MVLSSSVEQLKAVYDTDRNANPESNYIFTAHGLDCSIQRNGFGAWCGYVKVDNLTVKQHKALEDTYFGYSPIKLYVHGGITYSETHEQGRSITLGFDCCHICDYVPEMVRPAPEEDNPLRCWTREAVTEETEILARQIAKAMQEME